MTDSVLAAIRIVLYEPRDPINIGAVVRAMKNMGVRDLRLVRPGMYEANRIEQVAHDTRDIVARIRHYETLEESLADCVRVAGFAGKPRAAKWPRTWVRDATSELLEHAAEGPVALLFGREDHGLPNAALDQAHVVVTIPTTEHMSLNLAQAVVIALYEMHIQAGDATRRLARPRKQAPAPSADELERAFDDAHRSLDVMGFFRTRNPELVMRSLRSLVFRARPDARELQLLRAMAIEVRRSIARTGRAENADT